MSDEEKPCLHCDWWINGLCELEVCMYRADGTVRALNEKREGDPLDVIEQKCLKRKTDWIQYDDVVQEMDLVVKWINELRGK